MKLHAFLTAGLFFFPVFTSAQLSPITSGQSGQTELRHKTMTEALAALKQAKNEKDKGEIYAELPRLKLEASEQLLSIYDDAVSREKELTTEENIRRNAGISATLSRVMRTATDPQFGDALVKILDRESAYKQNYLPAFFAGDTTATIRFDMRLKRIEALTHVAAETKNRNALPGLRKMVDLPMAGEYAATAIGQIGDPQDLEDFIKRIEENSRRSPSAMGYTRINLNSFGPSAVDRIMQEVDNPATPQKAKYELVSSLRYMLTDETRSKYVALLDHKDFIVARVAAITLLKTPRPQDHDLIIRLLSNSDGDVRSAAMDAASKAWDNRYIPYLVHMLHSEAWEGMRAGAATELGNNNARAAIKDLQQAQNDRSRSVREEATNALNKMK